MDMPDTVFEFRNYTLHPGKRDVLIDLFERHFVESQDVLGARVYGTFRNLDDPDRFIWMRGFVDMDARAAALDAFYTGPVWRAHRAGANAAMIDSDDVLKLRPISAALSWAPAQRQPVGATGLPSSLFVATIYFLASRTDEAFAALFAEAAEPMLLDDGATFATEHSVNSFPNLPVRDETVFVTLRRFGSIGAYEAHQEALAASPAWPAAEAQLRSHFVKSPETLRLVPTARSLLR